MSQKVDTLHPEYTKISAQWDRCRDAYGGADLVKAKGTLYLPRPSGMNDDEYAAYLKRAEWFGATARTVDGLTGAVFRKEPAVEAPIAVQTDLKDITLGGVTLPAFARQGFTELLTVGRGGVLVDMPPNAGVNGRPYWVWYDAEQIVNWRTISIDGDTRLALVVLKEHAEQVDDADYFTVKTECRYRVLRLIEQEGALVYEMSLWRKLDKQPEYLQELPTYPTRRGTQLTFIPFVFLGPEDITPTVRKPPLLDLADTNLSHFRTSADYEHGLHFCGLPTPVVTGGKVEGTLKIGSGTAWCIETTGADVKMLEFTGQGLKPLETAMDRKEQRMAKLGARMIEHQKRDAEAAETLRIRQSGDHSTLAKIAHSASQAFTFAAQVHAWWRSASSDVFDPKVSVTLSQDFVGLRLTAEEVKALMLSWQAGGISFETFYHLLSEGGWARPGVDAKQEREAIDAELPDEPEVDDEPPDPNDPTARPKPEPEPEVRA